MIQFQENTHTDGRTGVRTDRPFQLPPGVHILNRRTSEFLPTVCLSRSARNKALISRFQTESQTPKWKSNVIYLTFQALKWESSAAFLRDFRTKYHKVL